MLVLLMQLAVPVTASDDDLRHVAAFRSRNRLPVSYLAFCTCVETKIHCFLFADVMSNLHRITT